MSDELQIIDFLEPIEVDRFSNNEYKHGQIGNLISIYEHNLPSIDTADIVLVGCGEQRGHNLVNPLSDAPDKIRDELYQLYSWHTDIKLCDIGNIKAGATLTDSYAALKTVINELTGLGKVVVILGGSHDLTLAQYHSYIDKKKAIEATCVDALMDLNMDSLYRDENFLMEMLTAEPNYIRHYNHLAFQSYYIHPHMLETMDRLRFDCFRTGVVKDNIEEMEPVIRNSELFSFDVTAIAHAFAPANNITPNGLNGEEACTLMRFAGLSPNINTIGIYGYDSEKDINQLTAKQISHLIWYLLDGKSKGIREARLDDKDSFNEFHIAFAEVETTFLQSKKTGRWWMQLPDKKFIACSHKDYLLASSNEVPERWLRAQERN